MDLNCLFSKAIFKVTQSSYQPSVKFCLSPKKSVNLSVSIGKSEKKYYQPLRTEGRFKFRWDTGDTQPGTYKVLIKCKFPSFLNTFTWNEREVFHFP